MWKAPVLLAFLLAAPAMQDPEKRIKGLELELALDSQILRTVDIVQARIYVRNTSTDAFDVGGDLWQVADGVRFLVQRFEDEPTGPMESRTPLPAPYIEYPCKGCCQTNHAVPGPGWLHYSKEHVKHTMRPGTSFMLARNLSLMGMPEKWRDAKTGLPLPGTWWIQARVRVLEWGDYYSNRVLVRVDPSDDLPAAIRNVFGSRAWHTRAVLCKWGQTFNRFCYEDYAAQMKPFVDFLDSKVDYSQRPLLALRVGMALMTGRKVARDEEMKDPRSGKIVRVKAGTVLEDPKAALPYLDMASESLKEIHLRTQAHYFMARCFIDLKRMPDAARILKRVDPKVVDACLVGEIRLLKREFGMSPD